jgi:basic membrane protein A
MLTSMLKRVDVAVYDSAMAAKNGTWAAGITELGLREDGVGWALDENNASLVSEDMRAAIEAAKANIVAGNIVVHDYMSDNSCAL